jgi:hypothetical protein
MYCAQCEGGQGLRSKAQCCYVGGGGFYAFGVRRSGGWVISSFFLREKQPMVDDTVQFCRSDTLLKSKGLSISLKNHQM